MSTQPVEVRWRDCTCIGSCRGAAGLGPGWNCVVENGRREQDVITLPDKHPLRLRAEKAERERDEFVHQRDTLLVELLSLRALIHDLNVQDADDSWYLAVARADAVIDALVATARMKDGPRCAVCNEPFVVPHACAKKPVVML